MLDGIIKQDVVVEPRGKNGPLFNTNFEIEEGEVDYVGEDSALWRHIFVDGEWKEQNGKVVYT